MTERKPKPDDKRIRTTGEDKYVKLSDIRVAPLAQRKFLKAHAEAIAMMLDLDKIGKPVLNFRDGHWYVVDGQHRIAALRLFGFTDEVILCECFDGLTLKQEAELFLGRNYAKAPAIFQKYGVALTAERAMETDIERTVLAQGLKVAQGKQDGATSAITALVFVYDQGGPDVLGRTLRILRDAYGGVPGTLTSSLIRGVGLVCTRFNGDFEDAVAVDKLAHLMGGANGLMAKAYAARKQYGKPMADCVAAAVVDTYNRGHRGRKLQSWWKKAD